MYENAPKNLRKITILGGPAGVLGVPRGALRPKLWPKPAPKSAWGAPGGLFGRSWAGPGGSRGRPGGVWGRFWGLLWLSWGVLGAFWGVWAASRAARDSPKAARDPPNGNEDRHLGHFLGGLGPWGEPYGGGNMGQSRTIQHPETNKAIQNYPGTLDNPGQSKNQG